MDLLTLIARVRNLVSRAQTATNFADYIAVAKEVMSLVADIVAVFPAPQPVKFAAEGMSTADVCRKIDELCDAKAREGAADGPFIDLLLPMLLTLLKKLLGL